MNIYTKKTLFSLLLLFISVSAIYSQSDKIKDSSQDKIISLSAQSYQKETSEGVVLVDFWAAWCAPCRKMEPILKKIAAETDVKVGKLNIDNYMPFARMQKVRQVPTMIIYKNGEEVDRLLGIYSEEKLLEILNTYLNDQTYSGKSLE